jgi:hypothetical protein
MDRRDVGCDHPNCRPASKKKKPEKPLALGLLIFGFFSLQPGAPLPFLSSPPAAALISRPDKSPHRPAAGPLSQNPSRLSSSSPISSTQQPDRRSILPHTQKQNRLTAPTDPNPPPNSYTTQVPPPFGLQ